ncbi:hypothetical protein SAMD00019534_085800 [Acytostelium subglobosum LB1]|uniref:hypothetical protein n=1 Tax=Acytostelium subglobosum LB1 TaxID=1410327 RepID=UPI000644A4CF|nr:hypothetical protein SAMD00019534_085800 [Acytostelium subglobosum LB1]GAM25405.1 hypothetical protein SAMD00019534_085800 [Acytostelium subglobosum LB1]|eukprot:XP_012751925.1 hypothetical protein SAMD00019534_085800 [Acytostelium subglobosum LB1]
MAHHGYINLLIDRMTLNKRVSFGKMGVDILSALSTVHTVAQFKVFEQRQKPLLRMYAKKVVDSVAACNLDVLVYASKSYGATTNAIDQAATKGRLENVQYLHEHRQEGCTAKALCEASLNGHLATVMYLQQHYPTKWSTAAMDNAATSGHIDIVTYLHEQGLTCTISAMNNAAANGHLDVVKFLHENRTEGCTYAAMDNASEAGHLNVVRFLHENRTEGCTSFALLCSSNKCKDGSITRFLLENRTEGALSSPLYWAIKSRSLESIKALLEGHPNAQRECYREMANAIMTDDLGIIQEVFTRAERSDNPMFVKSLAHAYQQSAYTSFQSFMWMRQHYWKSHLSLMDRPVSVGQFALQYGMVDTLRYLIDEVKEFTVDDIEDYRLENAVRCGRLETVKFIYSRTSKHLGRARIMDTAAEHGRLGIVQLLHEQKASCTRLAIDQAALNGHLQVVQYLLENRTEGYQNALKNARTNHHHDIIKCINNHRRRSPCPSLTHTPLPINQPINQ